MPNKPLSGGLSSKEFNKFVKASYKKKSDAQHVNGYTLDKELSTKRSKVYVSPEGKVVHAMSGTDSASDWLHNPSILFGMHHKTDRYKRAEKVQKAANLKYGQDNVTTTSHSQSGAIAKEFARKGLTSHSVSLNPAIIGHHKGVEVVRSAHDPVSALTHIGKRDTTIEGKTLNPLIEHNARVLSRTEGDFGGCEYMPQNKRHMCFCMD